MKYIHIFKPFVATTDHPVLFISVDFNHISLSRPYELMKVKRLISNNVKYML